MTLHKEKQSPQEAEKNIASILLSGGVGVIPTDTLYGLVGSAFDIETVERIYRLRQRELNKPMIILISSLDELEDFGVVLNDDSKKILESFWPGKVSVVLSCENEKMQHLSRGGKTLAFRLPKDETLSRLLKKTGPLVAPSANLAGKKPAHTCAEAKGYFGEKIDFYVDAGKLESQPSTLIEIGNNGIIKILREGAVIIKN